MKKNILKTKSAFTLVELLVVVAIILIIATIGLTSFAPAQRKGRDARRKADLKDIQNAMESYYTVCNYQYPAITPTGPFTQSINCATPPVSILPTVPYDPRNTPYFCKDCGTSSYQICTTLEETSTEYCLPSRQ